ncbi:MULTISPECIES: YopX family protein [unclassified Enterococcus]|uniref:YopX family protein n=1 Tax=unclassified Enterococcus TaxID=2608891 RepID=UPI00155466FD|nr:MULTISPECIES: YopX family protein [unclassified Enterococcus]MBS7578391.1 hypothetical protein [Enterococcus sp. MMGLQ5-2]MBS7585622.1 hypothetical protein [Enterococcus sp. MMGLQ5-1]NPD13481.1 hypothetical protein [Enterococcus sp. MMGLQ5-1]NPD38223.1 hypothetical protein [Enterococcus sp. MMGLQ5-2]
MIPKFRCYSEDDKVMIYNVNPVVDADGDIEGIIFNYEICGYEFIEIELEKYVSVWGYDENKFPFKLMQSTGLKDKNGVEIFEGDIVEGNQYLTSTDTVPGKVKGVAKYSETKTMFYLDDGSNRHDAFINSLGSSIYQFEVIGNVHENPELLEVGE